MKNKITIFGAGNVGSTTAYAMILNGGVEEIALIDINEKLVRSQVMDLEHTVPFAGKVKVKVGDYEDCADSDVAVITCGAAQKVGETRLDLVEKNSKIIRDIVPKIFDKNPNITIVMITNPVDVLTYVAVSMFPDKKNQIIGTGTILDSARFRYLIGEKLSINPKSIHAYIVGEHGDSEVPLWSTASIGNMKLDKCEVLSEDDRKDIFLRAKNAAYAIIEGKQSTYYAIGAGAAKLVNTILFDKRTVLPVSHYIENHYGLNDICLSMPVVVGRAGVVGRLCVDINDRESKLLQASAATLRSVIEDITT